MRNFFAKSTAGVRRCDENVSLIRHLNDFNWLDSIRAHEFRLRGDLSKFEIGQERLISGSVICRKQDISSTDVTVHNIMLL